jgi:hypothetical protein
MRATVNGSCAIRPASPAKPSKWRWRHVSSILHLQPPPGIATHRGIAGGSGRRQPGIGTEHSWDTTGSCEFVHAERLSEIVR